MVDNIRLPRNSCRDDFTIDNDVNDNVDAFVDDELVFISVDTTELTDIMGDNGTPFFADTE